MMTYPNMSHTDVNQMSHGQMSHGQMSQGQMSQGQMTRQNMSHTQSEAINIKQEINCIEQDLDSDSLKIDE